MQENIAESMSHEEPAWDPLKFALKLKNENEKVSVVIDEKHANDINSSFLSVLHR